MKNDLAVTDINFEKEIINSSIPVLVDFWASWCIPSQMTMPLLEKLRVEFDGKIKINKINVDQNPRMRDRYCIKGCPTFILFKDGAEIARKIGVQSENQLKELLKSALKTIK